MSGDYCIWCNINIKIPFIFKGEIFCNKDCFVDAYNSGDKERKLVTYRDIENFIIQMYVKTIPNIAFKTIQERTMASLIKTFL